MKIGYSLVLCCSLYGIIYASSLQRPHKPLLVNGDFNKTNKGGFPSGWFSEIDSGTPEYKVVEFKGKHCLKISFDAGERGRLGQVFNFRPTSQYVLQCSYWIECDKEPAPELAIRVGAETLKTFWRVWSYASKTRSTDWQTLTMQITTPDQLKSGKGGILFFLAQNSRPGNIYLADVNLIEKPFSPYQRMNRYVASTGESFFPVRRQAPAPRLSSQIAESKNSDILWWTGVNGDAIWPGEPISPDTVCQHIEMNSAADASCSAIIGVYACKNIKNLSFDIVSNSVAIKEMLTLQKIRVWRQREWNRTQLYYDIPEIIENLPTKLSIKHDEDVQLILTANIASDIAAGKYIANIRVFNDGKVITEIPVSINVLPFKLAKSPAEFVWGIYPDPGRWANYLPRQLDEELNWIRSYGINSLLLYLPLAEIYKNKPLTSKNLEKALTDWETVVNAWGDRYMTAFTRAGFGPMVCNIQSLPSVLCKVMGEKAIDADANTKNRIYSQEFMQTLRRYIKIIEKIRVKRKWPMFYYHVFDEPGDSNNVLAASLFHLIHDMKLPLYTTANMDRVVRDFADIVDVFCCGYSIFNNRKDAQRVRSWIAGKPNVHLWQYGGAGTYLNQEGKIARNRYGCGFRSWRDGVSGAYFWTFQRVFGSAENDFDGSAGKDFCLTYPGPEGSRSVSTVQWEAVREGIIDYRYLNQLENLLSEALQDKNQSKAEKARKVEKKFDALREKLWNLKSDPDNRTLNQWRKDIAQWIVELQS